MPRAKPSKATPRACAKSLVGGIAQKALKDRVLRRSRQTRGQSKSPNNTPKKKKRKKAPKQTNITGLKKRGDPPASPANEPLPFHGSSPRPRLSSDPEKKRKLYTTTEQKQKKPCTKVRGHPHNEPKHTRAKAKPNKNQNLMPAPNT